MLAIFIARFFDTGIYELFSATLWFFSLCCVVYIYAMTSAILAKFMYRKHRMAFHKHIKSMMVMQGATIFTMAILIVVQVCYIYLGLCL